MADLLFVAIMVALLGVSVVFIHACDRIIGADDDVVIGVRSDDHSEDSDVLAA